jgi:hypothetical protein
MVQEIEEWVSLQWDSETNQNKQNDLFGDEVKQTKKRGSVAYYELRNKFIYKRAHSELQLLNCLDDKKIEQGVSYNFITQGDVDQLSYLMLVMRTLKKLDYLLVSTWCCSSEDIVYLFNLHEQGKLNKLDFYVGEIFQRSYPKEYELLLHFYKKYPIGRICLFPNNSKIFAGISNDNIGFVVQTSANMNTNPRTENGNIQLDNGLFEFYRDYFNGINSFM